MFFGLDQILDTEVPVGRTLPDQQEGVVVLVVLFGHQCIGRLCSIEPKTSMTLCPKLAHRDARYS